MGLHVPEGLRRRLYKPRRHPVSGKILESSSHSHTHNSTTLLNSQLPQLTISSRDQPTHSQWRPSSKPSTTSPRLSRALPLVSARRPTRRLPRTATSPPALGKPEQIFREPLCQVHGPLTNSSAVCPLARTLLVTRSTRLPTTTRPRLTSSWLSTTRAA